MKIAVLGTGTVGQAIAARPRRQGPHQISNPLDFAKGFPPTLFVKDTESLVEQIQRTGMNCDFRTSD